MHNKAFSKEWVNYVAASFFEFDLILLVTAALVGMAVTTIWKKLSSKP